MVSIADLLFVAGLAVVVVGGWYCGTGPGVMVSGGTFCLMAFVARRVQLARRRTRQR